MSFDIDHVESLWVLGMLPCESLPDVALTALQNGIDNEPLRILAGLSSVEGDEASNFFVQALNELGRGQLTKQEAVRIYTKYIAEQILFKEMEPYVGARKIWDAALKISDVNFHDVDPFIYAASEYEDRPEDCGFFSKAILEEAQRWTEVTRGEPN